VEKFTKVLENKKHHITHVLNEIIFPNLDNDWKLFFKETKSYIKYYVVDQVQGFSRFDEETFETHFSVPNWAFRNGEEYFAYYVAHELTHAFANCLYRPKRIQPHGEIFYNIFKAICPIYLQPYEHLYKPRNAKKYGVVWDAKIEKIST